MIALAESGHPRAAELLEKAKAVDEAATNGSAKKLLGAWARARKLWCEITGEPLV
jgi:hypothetical protein